MAVNPEGESEPLVTTEPIKAKYPFGEVTRCYLNLIMMRQRICRISQANFEVAEFGLEAGHLLVVTAGQEITERSHIPAKHIN